MGEFRRVVNGVLIEMHPTTDEAFAVAGDGQHLVMLTRVADDGTGHGRWLCPCGHASGKRDPMLAHVVAEFAKVSPLVTAEKGFTFEAMNTYLRLAGKHADPTYCPGNAKPVWLILVASHRMCASGVAPRATNRQGSVLRLI